MKNCIFLTNSVTNALKAKRILSEYSIYSNTVKVNSKQKEGCMHGIEVNCNHSNNVKRILTASKIKFSEYSGDLS